MKNFLFLFVLAFLFSSCKNAKTAKDFAKTDLLKPGEIVSFQTQMEHKIKYHAFTSYNYKKEWLMFKVAMIL